MKVQVNPKAELDIQDVCDYYERQGSGVGDYFRKRLLETLRELRFSAGVYAKEYGFQRVRVKRFPIAVFYEISGDIVQVLAVIDMRRDPDWIAMRLRS